MLQRQTYQSKLPVLAKSTPPYDDEDEEMDDDYSGDYPPPEGPADPPESVPRPWPDDTDLEEGI